MKISRLTFVIILAGFISCAVNDKTAQESETLPPTGLLCELMEYPEKTVITDASPEFCWIVNSALKDDFQSAYQILLASSMENLNNNIGDMWDTEKIKSAKSIDVEYEGKPLLSNTSYFWKVRTWNKNNEVGPYSSPQHFRTGTIEQEYSTARYPLEKNENKPVRIVKKGKGHYFIDFGKAAFGTVKLTLTSPSIKREVEVHLGEVPAGENSINRNPGGSRRYRKMVLSLEEGTHTYVVLITPDRQNTRERAIKMPEEIGEVMPFRYCEIINCPGELEESMVRQVVVNYPFNYNTSRFTSSNKVLNDVWELCKYSIKTTSFCGVYVDGDRERIPYEADAYINQLCHYSVDREFTMARYTHEYLITHPTWPTEWILHSILMAWADYQYTGNTESIEKYYEDLKAKTLLSLEREDGLISVQTGRVTDEVLKSIHFAGELKDIVDWPHGDILGLKGGYGETDGFEFKPINTVVNAFHYQALSLMSQIAKVLNKTEDCNYFRERAELVKKSINENLFDTTRGIYLDGEGSTHTSLHANMFPLAFGLVPEEHEQRIADFIKTRGMACSVYGSQYLLESLYEANEDDYALSLLTSTSERSWAHMIYDVGTTITLEAWDNRFKPNQDWNHAWGAAPANIIPRFLMGVQPIEPGFSKIQIKPQVGALKSGTLDLPTIRGTLHVHFEKVENESFSLKVQIPSNTKAKVYIPKLGIDNSIVMMDGVPREGIMEKNFVVLDNIGSGEHQFERHR